MSTTTSINIRIPQGSVLSPLFFNICINDIKNCTNKFDIVSYADDTTLISKIDSFTSPNTNISDNIIITHSERALFNLNACVEARGTIVPKAVGRGYYGPERRHKGI